MKPIADRGLIHNFLKAQLREESIHGGSGLCRHAMIFRDEEMEAPIRFINYTVLPPCASFGLHRHGNDNEFYIVLSGSGVYTQDGRDISVEAGDIMMNPPGGAHAIRNTGHVDMALLVFEVAIQPDSSGASDTVLVQND